MLRDPASMQHQAAGTGSRNHFYPYVLAEYLTKDRYIFWLNISFRLPCLLVMYSLNF